MKECIGSAQVFLPAALIINHKYHMAKHDKIGLKNGGRKRYVPGKFSNPVYLWEL